MKLGHMSLKNGYVPKYVFRGFNIFNPKTEQTIWRIALKDSCLIPEEKIQGFYSEWDDGDSTVVKLRVNVRNGHQMEWLRSTADR